MLAQLNHFPQPGNALHTPSECRDVLNALPAGGIVFHCNKADGSPYVIPDEIRAAVMNALGLELGLHAWGLLLDALTVSQLKLVLTRKKLPTSGTKLELKGRVLSSGLNPSRVLGILSNRDLHKLCSSLPGVPVSGTKAQRVRRIIGYFANLITKEVSDEASPGERFLQVPAGTRPARPRESACEPDHHQRRRYRARVRSGNPVPLPIKAGRRVDGDERQRASRRMHPIRWASEEKRDVLMWDNKSTEATYSFPPSHLKQFKRYIRDASDPVACFLVIVAKPDDSAMDRVWQLAAQCAGTQVAVIAAEDLGWIAEEWWSRNADGRFNLEVLNMTGILGRPVSNSG